MDRAQDHYSWSHGVTSYYSSHVFNSSSLPLPSTSLLKSHNQYHNYSSVRYPEPRRPYECMTYQPFKYYQDNYHGSPYFSRNPPSSQNNNQIPVSNYYSSYRIPDCQDCSNYQNNNCKIRNERANIYQNNYNYKSRCVDTCPNLDVRQFWSTWQDKDDDVIDAHGVNSPQNVVYHVQDPFHVERSRRDTYKSNNVAIAKVFTENCINEQAADLGYSSIPFYSEENFYKNFPSSENYSPVNYKHNTEEYYSLRPKESHKNDHVDRSVFEQRHVKYAPYYSEKSHYNLTSSLESDEHFDDINSRNEESYKNINHELIHERCETVCCNEDSDCNLRNQWVHNNIQKEKQTVQKKNIWKETSLEHSVSADGNVTPPECNDVSLEDNSNEQPSENTASLKSENKSFHSPLTETLIAFSSSSIADSLGSEKCKYGSEEVSSEDIYISITSSDVNSETRTTLKELQRGDTLDINLQVKEQEINKISLENETIVDSSSCDNRGKEISDLKKFKINYGNLNKVNSDNNLDDSKKKDFEDPNEESCLEKVKCHVQTQVRLSDFKHRNRRSTTNESSNVINFSDTVNDPTSKHENEENFDLAHQEELTCASSESGGVIDDCNKHHIIQGKRLHELEESYESIEAKFVVKYNFKSKKKHIEEEYFHNDYDDKNINNFQKPLINLENKLKNHESDDSSILNNESVTEQFMSKDASLYSEEDLSENGIISRLCIDDTLITPGKNERLSETLNGTDNCIRRSKLKQTKKYSHKKSDEDMNDNLLLLAHCSQEYRHIHFENELDTILNASDRRKITDISRSIKCSLSWDRIFSNSFKKPVNENADMSIDLGPAKVELRMPSNLHVKPQWKIVRNDENKTHSSSIVHVKRLILKRKFNCKEKIPKMVIKRNDDKEYISYIKMEGPQEN